MTEPYTPSVKGAREDLRDWLRRYRTARNRKRDLDNRLKNVLADLNDPPLGCQGSGSPGSGTPSAGAAAIAYKIDEVEQRIKDQQGRMAQIFLETSEVIDLLPDIEDRQLLEKRYIDCQGWQQIEKDLYLARSNLARREAKALDTLLQHMPFCIPDIIIYDNDTPVAVIDAKYKMSGRPDRSDSHQLLAYVLLTGVQRCGFILPGNKTEVREMITSQDNYLPLAPRFLRYYELLLGSNSDSKELRKVLQ